jgi:hypothetical protein
MSTEECSGNGEEESFAISSTLGHKRAKASERQPGRVWDWK